MSIADEIQWTPIQKLKADLYSNKQVDVFVKREDLCHPIISGNKWHKLKLNLAEAGGVSRIASFGGAWSNHLHALAYTCMKQGIGLSAFIRGDELAGKALNPMLSDMKQWGADLHFLSREQYRLKEQSEDFLSLCTKEAVFVIPEGANNPMGIEGCAQFACATLEQFEDEQNSLPTHVLMAAGTGAMTSGFIRAIHQRNVENSIFVKSYLAVKDKTRVETTILENTGSLGEGFFWSLDDSYTGKGFAQVDSSLKCFMRDFYELEGFELDPVYTGKMFYGFHQDLLQNIFPEGSRILLIHSGGLQGKRGRSS